MIHFNFKVNDTWSMFQSGILHKNSEDLGLYDECINFSHNTNAATGVIEGKYSLLTLIEKS